MATRNRKRELRTKPTGLPVPLFLAAAFLLGVGTTWLVMRGTSQEPPKQAIESFLPPSGAGANVSAVSQVTPSVAAQPPDVSQFSAPDAARALGNWNYDRQDWPHAIEHYQQAIASGADNPDVRTDLGNCFRFLGQPQKALEQYQLAQKENPLHENSLFNQISLYADFLRDKQRAAATARDFLARFPQSPQAAAARKRLEESQK